MFANVEKLLKECPCKRQHTLVTDECVVATGAQLEMRRYIDAHGFKKAAIICDENTAVFTKNLTDAASDIVILTVDGNAHATEIFAGIAIDFVKRETPDVLIACGSGSVHDITRYAAFDRKVPFISYPTAASVDGFVSGVAAMTWYGQKLTFTSAPPIAVFADPDVFCTAPARLTASGVGDVIGKYTSLFDWRAAEILTGEYRCTGICDIEYEAINELCAAIENRSPETERDYTIKVMNANLLSGLAIQLTGNSRPASAAEHHMSHLWEMHCINEESDALHGEKVGVGLLLALREYKKYLKCIDIEKIKAIDLDKVFDRAYIESAYGSLTDATLAENLPNGKSSLADIKITETTVAELLEAAKALPEPEYAESLLKAAGAPTTLYEIGLPDTEEFTARSLEFAPYVRNRLTLLKVMMASKI